MYSNFFLRIKIPRTQSTERKSGTITEIQTEIAVPLLLSELWVLATFTPYPGVSPGSSSWFPAQKDGSAKIRFLSS